MSKSPASGGVSLARGVATLALAWGGVLLAGAPLLGVAWVILGGTNRISSGQELLLYPLAALGVTFAALVAARAASGIRCGALTWTAFGGALLWLTSGGTFVIGNFPLGVSAWLQNATIPIMVLGWIALFSSLSSSPADRAGHWSYCKPLLCCFLIGNALYLIQGLAATLLGWDIAATLRGSSAASADSERGSLITLAGHANYLGSTLALLFFLKLDAIFSRAGLPDSRPTVQPTSLKSAIIALMIADVLCIYLVGARGAFLSIACGLAAFVVLHFGLRRWTPTRLAVSAVSMVSALLIVGILTFVVVLPRAAADPEVSQTLGDRLMARGPITTRVHHWMIATELWKQHPLTGVGPGQFDAAHWRLLAARTETPTDASTVNDILASPFLLGELDGRDPNHAHDELFHAAAELGVVGLLGLIAAAIATCWAALSLRDSVLVAALVAVAVDAQFGFPLHTPAAMVPLSMLLGLIWWRWLQQRTTESVSGSAKRRGAQPYRSPFAWAGIGAVSLCVSFVLFSQSMRTMQLNQSLRALSSPDTASLRDLEGNLSEVTTRLSQPLVGERALLGIRTALGTGRGLELPPMLAVSSVPIDLKNRARVLQLQDKLRDAADLLRTASRLHPTDLGIAVDRARTALERWNKASRYESLDAVDLADRRSEEARFARDFEASESMSSGRRRLPAMKLLITTELKEAVDHLRSIDFRHPLIAYSEGLMAESNDRPDAALRIYQQHLVQSNHLRASESVESATNDPAQTAFAVLIDTRIQARVDTIREELNSP